MTLQMKSFFFFTVLTVSAAAQTPGMPSQSGQAPDYTGRPHTALGGHDPDSGADNSMRASMEAARLKAVETDRHKRMVADAEKLVQLANEIKAEVDKTSKDELSVTVLKKTAEMEKLAHDIRTRMVN